MKKTFFVLIVLTAFATTLFSGCSNGTKDSGNSSDGSSLVTPVSGKFYVYEDPDETAPNNLVVLSFAASGNIVQMTWYGTTVLVSYSMSGNAITVMANGEPLNFLYNSSTDTISGGGMILTRD